MNELYVCRWVRTGEKWDLEVRGNALCKTLTSGGQMENDTCGGRTERILLIILCSHLMFKDKFETLITIAP